MERLFTLKVDQFAEKHELFKEHATMLVAVSGGPDSMALLHYLKSIQQQWQFRLIALTVDHSLRNESADDVKYVTSMCDEWGILCKAVKLDVPTYKEQYQVGTQVAARHMRYAYFEEQMKECGGDFLVLGHHGDDQVETVFMRLTRSVEPKQIKGMDVKRPFSYGEIIRPFLGVTKREIEQYCAQHAIQPRLDPSNQSSQYTRNAFRMEVLPFLKEQNEKIHEHIQQFSVYAKEDEDFLQQEANRLFQSSLFTKTYRHMEFDRLAFLSVSPSLQRRTFHLILNYLYDKLPNDLSYQHWEQFKHVLKSSSPHLSIDLPDELLVIRSYDHVAFTFEKEESVAYQFKLDVPGQVLLPDGSSLHAEIGVWQAERNHHHFICDLNQVSFPLYVRTREPGDKIALRGMVGRKKVKDLFIDHKIPKPKRDAWPIVTDHNGKLLWVVSIQKAGLEANKPGNWLHITYKPG
ncbi:tRNA(Ile)-lysidine synthetase [Pontibacillus litoralis JSM 072002]|uniref:tRNA(Ile)-lysidine synthase n=1 Tax=Pontibacillus litoralis JSM 072002 TaxID=1385512 RepID=A0A0A5G0E9_9BACI|nr:tRNA(Ile)-lysidine synthetase [Pontibacillus litoralis JSM 072002]